MKKIFASEQKTHIGERLTPAIKNENNSIHIALLYGGMSAERPVSLMSFDILKQGLLGLGYCVTPVDVGSDFINVVADVKPDVVFNGLYGTHGEDGYIPALLDMMGLLYTHSGVIASRIGFNKNLSHEIFKSQNINIANSKIISKKDGIKIDPMKRPYVIKPMNEGSSVGVEVIFEEDDFDFANYEWKYGDEIIVEEYIPGKELQVAILDGKAVGTMDIIPLKRRFYDYDSKYKQGFAKHIVPAEIDKDIEEYICELAEKAHKALGCKTVSRVDFRYNPNKGRAGVCVLEINTHPGMTSLSAFPEICAHYGITIENILEKLVRDALL
jgi:D-alanine-D-alanine ligase